MINVYKTLVKLYWQGKLKYSKENLSWFTFVHHKSYMDWLGTKHRPSQWQAHDQLPEPWHSPLTFTLLMWRIWWAPTNASKWQMGFNSAFKGLIIMLSGRGFLRKWIRYSHVNPRVLPPSWFLYCSGLLVSFLYFRTVTKIDVTQVTHRTGFMNGVIQYLGLMGYRYGRWGRHSWACNKSSMHSKTTLDEDGLWYSHCQQLYPWKQHAQCWISELFRWGEGAEKIHYTHLPQLPQHTTQRHVILFMK